MTAGRKKEKTKAKDSLEKLVVVRLCTSHTCKTMSDLVHRHFDDKKLKSTVCTMIGPLFNFGDLKDAAVSQKLLPLAWPTNDGQMSCFDETTKITFLNPKPITT